MKLVSEQKEIAVANAAVDNTHRVETDETTYTRLGWWIVLVGFGGFVLWAIFAPLEKGVPISIKSWSRKEIMSVLARYWCA